ncbi:MAG: site-specific integrase [Halobacteria archaeon]
MQLEKAGGDTKTEYKCWMNTDEYRKFTRQALSYRDEIIIRLGGEVGLRSFEIPQIKPKHIRRNDSGEHYFLRVPRGKDTQRKGGKPRDAYLPRDLETQIHRYIKTENIPRDEVILDYTPRRIQQIVKETAEKAAQETGMEDFKHVSSHDLRRYYAVDLLVRKRMNPEVVMAIGGWEDYQSIKPYLSRATEETIVKEFERVGAD